MVSGVDCWRNLRYLSSRTPAQGSRDPQWAQEPENRPKTRARIYHFILGTRRWELPPGRAESSVGGSAVGSFALLRAVRTGRAAARTTTWLSSNLVSIRIDNEAEKLQFGFGRFWVVFRPNLAPRPVLTDRARKMMQNAPKISPRDQFRGRGPDPREN